MQPGTFSNRGRSRLIDSILRTAQNGESSRPPSVLSISAGSISEAGLTTLKKVNYQDKNKRISTLLCDRHPSRNESAWEARPPRKWLAGKGIDELQGRQVRETCPSQPFRSASKLSVQRRTGGPNLVVKFS